MSRSRTAYHLSSNRVEGSLCDVPLGQLLSACRRDLVTATIEVKFSGMRGSVELRAGAIEAARFADDAGERALARMGALRDGRYALTQRLPAPGGAMANAGTCRGSLVDMPLVQVMNHCEREALSCTVTVMRGHDRGALVYRLGELETVSLNDVDDEDTIVVMCSWREGRFRITAQPLSLDIDGWPLTAGKATGPLPATNTARDTPARRGRSNARSVTAPPAMRSAVRSAAVVPAAAFDDDEPYIEFRYGAPMDWEWDWALDAHTPLGSAPLTDRQADRRTRFAVGSGPIAMRQGRPAPMEPLANPMRPLGISAEPLAVSPQPVMSSLALPVRAVAPSRTQAAGAPYVGLSSSSAPVFSTQVRASGGAADSSEAAGLLVIAGALVVALSLAVAFVYMAVTG